MSLSRVSQVTTYDGPIERLGRAEQFFFSVTETPRAEAKLRAMLFMVQVRRGRSWIWRDHVCIQNVSAHPIPVPRKSQKNRAEYEHGLFDDSLVSMLWFRFELFKVCYLCNL